MGPCLPTAPMYPFSFAFRPILSLMPTSTIQRCSPAFRATYPMSTFQAAGTRCQHSCSTRRSPPASILGSPCAQLFSRVRLFIVFTRCCTAVYLSWLHLRREDGEPGGGLPAALDGTWHEQLHPGRSMNETFVFCHFFFPKPCGTELLRCKGCRLCLTPTRRRCVAGRALGLCTLERKGDRFVRNAPRLVQPMGAIRRWVQILGPVVGQ